MKTLRLSLTVAAALFLSSTALLAQSASDGAQAATDRNWSIGERHLPIPAGASAELQAALGAVPAPDVARSQGLQPGEEQLLAMQKASSVADLAGLSKTHGVDIEKVEIAGVASYIVRPAEVAARHEGQLFLHLHGGGYVLGGGDAAVNEAAMVSGSIGIESLSVDYRMPPRDPFPAAVHDAVAVYKSLLEKRPAASIAIGGTSAGGGLTLAAVHKIKALGLELPGAIWVGTPWADLTKTGDSLYTNEGIDRVLVTYDGMLGAMARIYAGQHDLKDPLLSPVYGDFGGFPPTQLVTGTRDMFLSDTARTHRKLKDAGVKADLNVYEGLSHAGYLMVPAAPESKAVFSDLSAFLAEHLP